VRHVAVIGGGPGGAQSAWRLAEAGIRVSVFEPRRGFEKPCGGGIPARGLDAYPFLLDPRLPSRVLHLCHLVSPEGAQVSIPLGEPLRVFSRADLHDYMLERAASAGAEIVRAKVLSFSGTGDLPGWWRVVAADAAGGRREHGPFDFLIAADGAAGAARRRLAGGPPASALTQAIGYYLPGIVEDAITLKFYAGLEGYLWVFPRGDHASAGICGPLGERPAARLRSLMDAFLAERYGWDVLKQAQRYAALIPAAPSDPRVARLQGDGWALVGDTGGSVDPLTREGIYFAMLSADLLAAALVAERPRAYTVSWRRVMGREFAWAARHAAGFFDPRFIERLVSLCARSPRTAAILSDLLCGRQRYRSLKLRLLANSPTIAWQAARRGPGPLLRPARGS
jgi:flavin-dependent dehydrogenase